MIICGLAGPFVVMAQNYVPETTAVDIESAMTLIGGLITSCKMVKIHPIVFTEIVLANREAADRIIEEFNNKDHSIELTLSTSLIVDDEDSLGAVRTGDPFERFKDDFDSSLNFNLNFGADNGNMNPDDINLDPNSNNMGYLGGNAQGDFDHDGSFYINASGSNDPLEGWDLSWADLDPTPNGGLNFGTDNSESES